MKKKRFEIVETSRMKTKLDVRQMIILGPIL
jgi:hypothetical protein